jgi:hypothetical protein
MVASQTSNVACNEPPSSAQFGVERAQSAPGHGAVEDG